jgi:hypothetical protein
MKLHVISNDLISNMLGPGFEYVYVPGDEMRRGFLVAWKAGT